MKRFSPVRKARWRWLASLARVLAFAALATASAFQSPGMAEAFCRSSLEASTSDADCVQDPSKPFLFWDRQCVSYVFNDRVFGRLTSLGEAGVRQAYLNSFQAWADVDCNRGPLFFVQQKAGVTVTAKSEFVYDERNEFVINALTREEWQALPSHNVNVIAVTLIWHNTRTGEILDVDMELNLGQGNFSDCGIVGQPCRSTGMVDLQNTVTHEAGHVLGLGHSKVPGATMEAQTSSNLAEVSKRSLEADDRAGYCALELPSADCTGSASCVCAAAPIYPSKTTKQSCSCNAVGARGPNSEPWVAWLALSAVLGLLAARRSSRVL